MTQMTLHDFSTWQVCPNRIAIATECCCGNQAGSR